MAQKIRNLFSNFDITIYTLGGGECRISVAEEKDISDIRKCYEKIWITDENVEKKLNIDSGESFYERGGMFDIPDEDMIRKELENPNSIVIISRRKDKDMGDHVNASLILTTEYRHYNKIHYDFVKESIPTNFQRNFIKAFNEGKVFIPLECIVLRHEKNKRLAYPFLYFVYSRLYQAGFSFALLEIYKLIGYREDNKYFSLHHENIPSIMLNRNLGAKEIGFLDHKLFKKENKILYIVPQVFALNLDTSLGVMKKQSDISIAPQLQNA